MTENESVRGRVEALYAEYLARVERGEALDLEAFCGEHPEQAGALRELDRALDRARLAGLPSELPGVTTDVPSAGEPGRVLERLSELRPAPGRYVVGERIAEGGMGCILVARDVVLHRDLAMKVLRGRFLGDERALARLIEEAQVTGQLEHPGIVPVYDLGLTKDDELFFVMKLVEGEDLSDVFRRVDRADRRELLRALGLVLRACEAIAYAHEKGVLHRDLKPQNIRVGRFGEVYVMDWGLAGVRGLIDETSGLTTERHAEGDVLFPTLDGDALGTPCFMSPEQAVGRFSEMDARSDVYSMGAILYELLAGAPPHLAAGESPGDVGGVELLRRARESAPAPLARRAPHAPPELISICEKAMEREPGRRYADMSALERDLSNFVEDRAVAAHATGAWVELRKWVRRNRAMATTLAASLVVLLGGAGVTVALLEAKNDEITREQAQTEEALANEQEALRKERAAGAQRDEALAQERAAVRERDQALDKTRDALVRETAAKEEAEAASRLARRRLAAELLSSGAAHGSRGRWRDALAAYDEARASDVDGELVAPIEFARSEAMMALFDREAALALLEDLRKRDDLGDLREAVELRLGALTLVGWQPKGAQVGPEEAEALVRAAVLSEALPVAEREFARALLAPTTGDVLVHLEAALADDPFHYFANSLRLSYLCLSGRFEEAEALARQLADLYPEDPTPKVALLVHRSASLQAGEAAALLDDLEGQVSKRALRTLQRTVTGFDGAQLSLHVGEFFGCEHTGGSLMLEAGSEFSRGLGVFRRRELKQLMPQVPSTRRAMELAFPAVFALIQNDFGGGAAGLREAVAIHPEGLFHYLIGLAEFVGMNTSDLPEMRAVLVGTIERCRLAERSPSVAPVTVDLARYMRARCEMYVAWIDYKLTGDAAAYEVPIRGLAELERVRGLDDCSFGILHREVLDPDASPPYLLEVSRCWRRVCPHSSRAALALVDDARRAGALGEALIALDELRLGERVARAWLPASAATLRAAERFAGRGGTGEALRAARASLEVLTPRVDERAHAALWLSTTAAACRAAQAGVGRGALDGLLRSADVTLAAMRPRVDLEALRGVLLADLDASTYALPSAGDPPAAQRVLPAPAAGGPVEASFTAEDEEED